MINKKRMLEEFFELVKIKSTSKEEREVAEVLKKKLSELGIEVREDKACEKVGGKAGNLIAYVKGTVKNAPVIMLSGHMDSVEPCENIKPVLKDGVITAESDTVLGADDKAGLAAILEALRCIKEQQLKHGDLEIIFTFGEEAGLFGSKYIDKQDLKADFGFVIDSSGSPGDMITAAPGENLVDVVIHGKKAHAGIAPEEGLNAILLAGKALANVVSGRIDSETTANVGIIKGGEATNVVPDKVELFCEVRSRNPEKLETETKKMVKVFEDSIAAAGGRVEATVKPSYSPYSIPEDAPVMSLALKAMEQAGIKPNPTTSGGGSDGNNFNSHGLPSLVLGVGMSKVHTKEEFIKEEDLYTTARLVIALINSAAEI